MNEIFFENVQKKIEIGKEIEELITKCCDATLKYEKIEDDCEISVTFCDNEQIHKLNMEFREIDRATDVLSFPMNEEGGEYEIDPANNCIVLGDIVLSVERALEQSKEYNHSFEREMAFLTVHSMLHLLFYDHKRSKEEEEIMFKKQDEILEIMGISR